jgi:outer membrane protein
MFRFILTTAVVLLVSVSSMQAQRVGYAEPQTILDALPDRERIEVALEQFYNQWEDDYNAAYERFAEELVLFNENRADLTQSQIQAEERRLNEMVEDLEMMQQEFGVQFERQRAELTAPVLEKINTAISNVAKEMSLDYVFNSETTQGEPLIFVIKENRNSINITSRVVELLSQ